jgi:uncharacterized protein (TIGR03435 family)
MMLRTLLADRFKLVMHRETKDLPIFELVLARQDGKLGPQLRRAAVDCQTQAAAARGEAPASSGPPGPGSCFMNMNPVSVRGGGVTLAMLANILSGPATQRLVIDRTGLTGNWDLEVKYTPDQSQVPPGVSVPKELLDPNGASLFTALEEQLGLKLRPARGPVEVLVIDSVQQPTPN